MKIVCCCGLAVVTANIVKNKLKERLRAEGFQNVQIVTCSTTNLRSALVGADLCLVTVNVDLKLDIPVFYAVGLMLDKEAEKKILDEVVAYLRSHGK